MSFKGTIYLFHNPTTKPTQLEVHAQNLAESPGTLTHNMFPTKQEALSPAQSHDDNGQFGHGNMVPNGQPERPGEAVQKFPMGGTYRGYYTPPGGGHYAQGAVPIKPGTWFRTGFRGRSYAVAEIPKPGEIVAIPYEEMLDQRQGLNWGAERIDRTNVPLPPAIQAVFDNLDPTLVRGKARIVPKASPQNPNELIGWDVWFINEAQGAPVKNQTHGFTATVTLVDAEGNGKKNAGLGLESMPCRAGGYSAKQFIKAGGNYGAIKAEPGANVRLGIRGYSQKGVQLPSLEKGKLEINLEDFEKTNADHQSDWFESDALLGKMGEKKGLVDFYRGKERINDELPDTIYQGEEAFIRAEFKKPPRLLVDRVRHSAEFPGGGWRVIIKNELPDADDIGPVGFNGALKLEAGGRMLADAAAIPAASFSPSAREATWFIPIGHNFAGVELTEGTELVLDSGPLGWRGKVQLPKYGEHVDTSKDEQTLHSTWVLRESDYHRAKLYPSEEEETP